MSEDVGDGIGTFSVSACALDIYYGVWRVEKIVVKKEKVVQGCLPSV